MSTPRGEGDEAAELYGHAVRLVAVGIPWIAAVQGAAIGGGLGLAMAADLRVAGERARSPSTSPAWASTRVSV